MDAWPDLATPGWLDTKTTLHLWSQIVGKTRLALEPMQNHWWQVPLYASARGLATPVLRAGDRAFEVELDLIAPALRVRAGDGRDAGFALAPMSVATFYRRYGEALASIGVEVAIHARPVEVIESIPFADDEIHASFDPAWARAFTTALGTIDRVMKEYRGGFLGKASPVHFFWGSFDLAATRFSGRPAPLHPGGAPNCPDYVMREAYSHECASAGFWPGDASFPEAAFYAYAYPAPDGYERAALRPAAARWDPTLREHVLPYAAVRASRDPRGDLLAFLESTYAAAAELARWDRRALERQETPS